MQRSVFCLLAALLIAGSHAEMCSFSHANYRLLYGVSGGRVYFRLFLSNVPFGMNVWTAVAFGDSMFSGLDVIVVRFLNGRVIVTDEYVRGYTRPFPDTGHVNVSSAQFTNGVLVVSFSRPVNTNEVPYDMNLQGCKSWKSPECSQTTFFRSAAADRKFSPFLDVRN